MKDPEEVRRQAEQDALEGLRRLNRMKPKKPLPQAPAELAPPGNSLGGEYAGGGYQLARAKAKKRRRAALGMA